MTTPDPETPARRRRRRSLRAWAILAVVGMVALVAIAALTARVAVLTPQGRLLIEARTSGLNLGRIGRLKIAGIGGDVWRRFTVRRLTISDERGVWLDGRDLDLRWDYAALLERRLRIDDASAGNVLLLRRPSLGPKGPSSRGLPISVDIRRLHLRVEAMPAFAETHGVFDVQGGLMLRRRDLGEKGELQTRSLTHPGDYLNLSFDVRRGRPMRIDAQGQEAQGGALAGALGLSARQPFSLIAHADGTATSGQLDVRLTSGAQVPLDAHGGWSARGGAIAGRADLAASSLTRGYAPMFGPRAVLALAARQAKGGRYGVALRLQAKNLALAAQGPAEPATLSSVEGLHVAVIVADLSRVLSSPKLGRGQAQGVLAGNPASWRFQGTANVLDARFEGYRAASLAGPVTLVGHGQEIAVKTAVAAAGGSGSGLLPGLLGPRPKATADVLRLADGRLMIRRVDAAGEAFRLQASGSRGLLGALQLKGELQIADLGKAYGGAAGSLKASWSASQGSPSKPWALSVDGHGAGFRSGVAELDRLLGGAPRVRLSGALDGRGLAVSALNVAGAKAQANAEGRLEGDGELALQTSWSAEGPFQAGPVQITGKATGSGAVTGTLSAPRADLTADFAALDVPRLPIHAAHAHLTLLSGPAGLVGGLAVNGATEYGPARASAAFRMAQDGLDLSGIDADAAGVQAKGALALRNNQPSSADLTVAVGPGVLLTKGRIEGAVRLTEGAGGAASVDLRASDAVLRGSGLVLSSAHLTGSGPLSRMPFTLAATAATPQGPLAINGSGVFHQSGTERTAEFSGSGSFQNVDFRTVTPVAVRFAGADRSLRGRLAVGGGQLDLDLGQTGAAADLRAVLHGVDIKALDKDFEGRIDADARLLGQAGRLTGAVNANLVGARSVDAPADLAVNAAIKASLNGDRLDVQGQATGARGMRADLDVALPVEASAAPLRLAIVRNRAVRGRFNASGDVGPLWNLVYGSERELAGEVRVNGEIAGTLADPKLTGAAAVSGGRFRDFATGLVLSDLSLNADLKGDVITLRQLSAKDEKTGQMTGSGSVSLERGGGSNLALQLKGFRLFDNDTAQATATGEVAVTRTGDGKVQIKGDLVVDRAEINAETKLRPSVVSIDVTEKNLRASGPVVNTPTVRAGSGGPPIALDVQLHAPRRVMIKGRGLNAELSLQAHVTGTLAQPVLEGRARIVQGDYDFAGKRFDFDDTGVIYLATAADQIRLELSATWQSPSLTATIRIRGTAAKPQITLTSTPSLPQEEILSQVLFGTSAAQLSGAETAQLASTVTSLATGGGFDVLGSVRQFARLDRLAIGGDQRTGTTIAGGKYLTNDVYIELVGGGRYGPSAEVDWRIRRGLSLVSQVGGEFGARLAFRWTRDIGRHREGRERRAH